MNVSAGMTGMTAMVINSLISSVLNLATAIIAFVERQCTWFCSVFPSTLLALSAVKIHVENLQCPVLLMYSKQNVMWINQLNCFNRT
jgi:hypothetical protein